MNMEGSGKFLIPPTAQLRRPSLKFKKSFRTRKRMADRQCSELALEGERLCRDGHWEAGIQRLEAATKTGSTDTKTLSALYSQLGNAYFYLEDFSKAIEYHRQDLTLARQMGDKLGEAKSCGNIGSALKALGQHDEAIACCRMQLDLARELRDRVLESRALYNLGNVYHAKGKQVSVNTQGQSQEEVEEQVRYSLEQAARHYEANLKIVRERGDYQAQGRTVGNLGNTYYLLGNYKKAIKYHEERLSIADHLNDYVARRRALSNLGNAYVFLGKYSNAEQSYLAALEVAREINDVAFMAQSCYSLGNTYTLLQNYPKAVEYHSVHMQYAQQLEDRVGEARAYWSLGNAFTCLGDHRNARHYAEQHLQLALELGDMEGVSTARQNLKDLDSALDLSDKYECASPKPGRVTPSPATPSPAPMRLKKKLKEKVTFKLDFNFGGKVLHTQSPDNRSLRSESTGSPDSALGRFSLHESSPTQGSRDESAGTDDGFFDMICKYQSQRMDEQRASLPSAPSRAAATAPKISAEEEDLLEMLWQVQHTRINDQRCDMPSVPHLNSRAARQHCQLKENEDLTSEEEAESDDEEEVVEEEEEKRDNLLELIVQAQGPHPNDQRCSLPPPSRKSTMPSEDFFNLIQHLQSTRIEDQRSPLPVLAN